MKEGSKICCVFNYASHYRYPIYSMMGERLGCHFYFGDSLKTNVKKIDYSRLAGFQAELKNRYLYKNIYYIHGTIKLLSKYSIFITSGEPFGLSTWLFLFFAKILGKKTYVWTHGWYGRESVKKRILKKLFFFLPKGILLYGSYARNLMIKEGISSRKMYVINNSLDYESQIEVRKKLTKNSIYIDYFKNELPILIFVGRLNRSKKISMIFEALTLCYEQEREGFNLVLIGGGDDEQALKIAAMDMKLEHRVWFYGACYDELEIGNLIYNADLCVSPGEIGLTAMHSLVYGTPVITHSNFSYQGPEFEAIKEGLTGTFFEDGNVVDLSNKIQYWLDVHSRDHDEVRELCYKVIDKEYNPFFQMDVLCNALKIN